MEQNKIIQYAFEFERVMKLKQTRKNELLLKNKMKLCDLILSYDKAKTYSFKQLQACYKSQLIDVVLQFEGEKFLLESHVREFVEEVKRETNTDTTST